MIREDFQQEGRRQILGSERTCEEVSAIIQVASHQWRWGEVVRGGICVKSQRFPDGLDVESGRKSRAKGRPRFLT